MKAFLPSPPNHSDERNCVWAGSSILLLYLPTQTAAFDAARHIFLGVIKQDQKRLLGSCSVLRRYFLGYYTMQREGWALTVRIVVGKAAPSEVLSR